MIGIITIEDGSPYAGVRMKCAGATFKETIPITVDFNYSNIVGKAKCFFDGNKIKAEINIPDDLYKSARVLRPSIGYKAIKTTVLDRDEIYILIAESQIMEIGLTPNGHLPSIQEQLNAATKAQ